MFDLLRAIKQTDTAETPAPVKESVRKTPLSELSLIDAVTQHFMSPDQRPAFRPGIHPSEISYEDPFCPRWHMFRQQLVRAQEEGRDLPFGVSLEDKHIEPELMRIFEMGHAIHSMYQNGILGQAGLLYGYWERWNAKTEKWEQERGFRPEGRDWVYQEPKIRSKGVRGQCDGIIQLEGRWLALEIKSSNDQAFNFRKKVKNEHLRQAQVYANLGFVDFPEVEVEGIIFLYVNKNTSKEREFIVPKDASSIRDILEGLDVLLEAERNEQLPERSCMRKTAKRANACPVKEVCFNTGSGKDALIQIRNA